MLCAYFDGSMVLFDEFCQVEPLGRLGESLVDHAVKNRDFSPHDNCCHFLLESDIWIILFSDD